ncbi:two-component sensor histidine kinase [Marinobacterium zhoushanense]|uniref:histidine kinase n=1 Tax=Marinobacterium zhoushanense TaxID=1679163 RepID=A0ABQ1KUM6_9GAMM|nr:ATP-binding protein [Marinobacterium zhoushanense]GGC06076.1 two-component sensor histidine kinase [Marinobacterium zhoushanense]
MHNRLLWRLFAINAVIIATVILVVWLAVDYLAASYFMVLMDEYHISPDDANALFLDSIHRYLIWGSLLAFALSLLLSVLLTRRVLRPLSRMAEVTRRVAAGDYSARVGLEGDDEIARLGQAFDRMTAALARLEHQREQMVADAAHELRTPLSNVQGYLEAMRDGVIQPSEEVWSMLLGEVQRLTKLAESLLDLARADAARSDLHLQAVSLTAMVEEALELGRPMLEARGIRVECALSKEADRVYADPDKLHQVLRNLIENAGHYATEGGRLQISLSRQREFALLSLRNDGQTFTAEDAPYVFERFFRADRSRARGKGVAGVGLAIVKELVEAQGGEVGARVGDGQTELYLTLPLLPSTSTATERTSTATEREALSLIDNRTPQAR